MNPGDLQPPFQKNNKNNFGHCDFIIIKNKEMFAVSVEFHLSLLLSSTFFILCVVLFVSYIVS